MCGCTALRSLVWTETGKTPKLSGFDEDVAEKARKRKLQHKMGMILLNKKAKKELVLAPLPSTLTVVML